MFIKCRCLYVVSNDKRQSRLVYNEISKLGIIDKFFNNANGEAIYNFLSILPDQTIFAKSITTQPDQFSKYYISLPFFSSHFKIPLKTGEYVWIYPYTIEKDINKYNINSYWVSRVHGFLTSEDVNYTFNDRDSFISYDGMLLNNEVENISNSIKKSKQKKEQKQRNKDLKDAIIKPAISFGNKTFELDDSEVSYLTNSIFNKSRCIPYITKNPDDLVLQGSNNTLIKLTSINSSNNSYTNSNTQGEITISTGTGNFIKSSYSTKSGNFIDNIGNFYLDDNYEIKIPEDSKLPLILKFDNHEENLKTPENYSYSSLSKQTYNEGATNLIEDASRISLTENFNHDDNVNINYDYILNISDYDSNLFEKEIQSNLLDVSSINRKDDKFKINVFTKNIIPFVKDYNIPSINLTSSNISLFSRLGNGSTSLIKEYYNDSIEKTMNSYVSLKENGDIFIDANRIFIGSAELEKRKGTFENGKGTLIRLGESDNAQSLVLGEQLKKYILEMSDVHREDMHQTKVLFEETKETLENINDTLIQELTIAVNNFSALVNQNLITLPNTLAAIPAPLAGAAVSPIIAAIYNDLIFFANNLTLAINKFDSLRAKSESNLLDKINDTKLKRDEEISKRLEKIEQNIDKILSKISKTS